MKEGKEIDGKVIPRDSLKYYLEQSPEFIGTVKGMRFKIVENPNNMSSTNTSVGKTWNTAAMVFDYEAIKAGYGIDLDISNESLDASEMRDGVATPPSVGDAGDNEDTELFER